MSLRQSALSQRCFLLSHLNLAGLAAQLHRRESLDLKRIDADLIPGHIQKLHIVENLHISLRHGDTDIFASLLKISRHGLEVQFVMFNRVVDPESLEHWH